MKAIKILAVIILCAGFNFFSFQQVLATLDSNSKNLGACLEKTKKCTTDCEHLKDLESSQNKCQLSCNEEASKCESSSENQPAFEKLMLWGVTSGVSTIAIIFCLYLLVKLGIKSLFSTRRKRL